MARNTPSWILGIGRFLLPKDSDPSGEGGGYVPSNLNIANLLTVGRLFFFPFLVQATLERNRIGFLILMLLHSLLDMVDGYLARRLRLRTELGKKLDYYVDNLILIPAHIMFFILAAESLGKFLVPAVISLSVVHLFIVSVKLFGFLKFGRFPHLHLRSKQFPGTFLFLFFVTALLDYPNHFFLYIYCGLRSLGYLEELFRLLVFDKRTKDRAMELKGFWYLVTEIEIIGTRR